MITPFDLFKHFPDKIEGPSWPLSHCCCVYSYLCNRWPSPLMLWVRIPLSARCTTLCDKVCQWLATGLWFYPGTPISFYNNYDHPDIIEILFKVTLNTIKPTKSDKFGVSQVINGSQLISFILKCLIDIYTMLNIMRIILELRFYTIVWIYIYIN